MAGTTANSAWTSISIHDSTTLFTGPIGRIPLRWNDRCGPGRFELYPSFGQSTGVFYIPNLLLLRQDQFRATRRLNFELRLRYDLQVLPRPNPCNPRMKRPATFPTAKYALAASWIAYFGDSKNSPSSAERSNSSTSSRSTGRFFGVDFQRRQPAISCRRRPKFGNSNPAGDISTA